MSQHVSSKKGDVMAKIDWICFQQDLKNDVRETKWDPGATNLKTQNISCIFGKSIFGEMWVCKSQE